MKNARQKQILTLISEQNIETQEELIARLKATGFSCTQATVSRDIKELKLIKVAGAHGGYHYAQSHAASGSRVTAKYDKILTETVVSADYAGNMVVVKTFTGMAMAACAAIDALHWEGMLGTIAGDDTIFIVVKDEQHAGWIAERLNLTAAERT